MKTVIINGSPRMNGDTAALIDILKDAVHGEHKQFNVYDGSIRPCIDCRACHVNDQCSIQDAFSELLDAIDDADVIVLASPVYFSELTGPLLSVASRLQYVWVSNNIRHRPVISAKPRRGIIVLTGGGQGSVDKALHTATCLLRQMGAQSIDSVCSLHTDCLPARQDEEAKRTIRELADTL